MRYVRAVAFNSAIMISLLETSNCDKAFMRNGGSNGLTLVCLGTREELNLHRVGIQKNNFGRWEFMTATNGMTKRHPLENQHRSSFTLLTCPVPKERSFHLSFRTSQRTGHPHPALSRSTPGDFSFGSFTENFPANRVRNATATVLSGAYVTGTAVVSKPELGWQADAFVEHWRQIFA
jgi:hypothetical protein